MRTADGHTLYRTAKIMRFLLAPLVLFALAALIAAHNARSEEIITDADIIRHLGPSVLRGGIDSLDGNTWGSNPSSIIVATPWARLLDQDGGSRVHFGVKIGGPLPFERAAREAFVPASVTKVFTTAAALEALGADYRFATRLSWREIAPGIATELVMTGSGDPTWGADEFDAKKGLPFAHVFDEMAKQLAQAGVREVRGDLRLVSPSRAWDDESMPPGWQPLDLVTCDGALPHAFNVSLNCAALVVRDADHAAWLGPELAKAAPLRTRLARGDKTSLHAVRDGAGYVIQGTWAPGTEPRRLALPVPDPTTWAHALLVRALVAAKIKVVAAEPAPATGPIKSVKHLSPPLHDILKPFLKFSINLVGQDLMIAMGGMDRMRSLLHAMLSPTDAAMLEFHDGCGMSHDNHISPQATYALLSALSHRKDFDVIWNALPIAGVDGTLAWSMQGTAAEGVLRAKTGTLTGAYTMAGYVPRYNAAGQITEYVPFVVLAAAKGADRYVAVASQNRVGAQLSSLVNH
jgi:D-alanyl-D-alanine carboxypeptidase/D-alanyl-D-alanine-endopeptidase (penicillin-binding protein 4)